MRTLMLIFAMAGVEPARALAAEPVDLQFLERTWHDCVSAAYDRQSARGSKAGRERNALDECRPDEDAYVAALMATRPDDADLSPEWPSAGGIRELRGASGQGLIDVLRR